ncbi:LysR family transcriptional regulator [Mucilaginibacter sp. P25]|uniref:DNA-binding transcriptional regulator, LysR family n=1 Tax=Mucilaginibacter gossypii TaxID=551996 RepID=A0A1G8JXM4_9SPHI|nr:MULTISPECIES: LysR family transcriptional regulator [Mucilaginibacter]QTE36609.1 LysR family transcriptional regulator [Mucilaginibacter gossypii]RAV58931.1 LysR family transcriptional regulator [Mucilaginibacter rubeus]SDI35908.1 DNA-binding transcriptional regulator, LysR family [Mucilaginibacter gossypii]
MVNFEWFRTFKAIYETGSLTGAAEALFISQPGVSLHLSSLESYVGYKLFDRTSRKMVSTERGKILYNYILEAICKLEDAERHFHKSTEKDVPTISIGMCFETFQFTLESYLPTLPFNVIIKFGEYPEMLADLDNGILDMIVTPHKGDYKGLEYKPFFKERIVVLAGAQTPTDEFNELLKTKDLNQIQTWLKAQTWYGSSGDMEHLRRFWHINFGKRPDFKPNFIVPNMGSIIRCLSNGKGIAVIPDFLSRKERDSGNIKLLWEGYNLIENTLYFGTRKKSIYAEQVGMIQEIFEREMV